MGKRSEGFERRQRGFYPTPLAAFKPLVPRLSHVATYIDPCAGDGALCHHLANGEFYVGAAFDIEPQHPHVKRFDACELTAEQLAELPNIMFVTNPPWPEPHQNGEPTLSILEHLRGIAPTWLLLPSDFMHNVYAAEPMRFCAEIVSVGRVKWIPGSKDDGKDNCAWYLFMPFANGGVLGFTGRQPKRKAA